MKPSDLLRGIGNPVSFYPRLTKVTGGVTATLLLCQLIYWHDKGRLDDNWIYKTQTEIEEELGLSRKEQETARKMLRERGFLEEKKEGIPRRLFYRLDLEILDEQWTKALETPVQSQSVPKGHTSVSRSHNKRARNAQQACEDGAGYLCTEITPESTGIDHGSESTEYPKASASLDASRDNGLHSNSRDNALDRDHALQHHRSTQQDANATQDGATGANATTAKRSTVTTGANATAAQEREHDEAPHSSSATKRSTSTQRHDHAAAQLSSPVNKLKTGTPPVPPPLPVGSPVAATFLPPRQKEAKPAHLAVDSEGRTRLPRDPIAALPRFLTVRRMQYWLAFDIAGCAEPAVDDDGYVLTEGNEIVVSSLKDKQDDEPEDTFFASNGNFALGALKSYAVAQHGMTEARLGKQLQTFYDESVEWCREAGDQAELIRKGTSVYFLFDEPDLLELFA